MEVLGYIQQQQSQQQLRESLIVDNSATTTTATTSFAAVLEAEALVNMSAANAMSATTQQQKERFKIVKIRDDDKRINHEVGKIRDELTGKISYKRGRWSVVDFYDVVPAPIFHDVLQPSLLLLNNNSSSNNTKIAASTAQHAVLSPQNSSSSQHSPLIAQVSGGVSPGSSIGKISDDVVKVDGIEMDHRDSRPNSGHHKDCQHSNNHERLIHTPSTELFPSDNNKPAQGAATKHAPNQQVAPAQLPNANQSSSKADHHSDAATDSAATSSDNFLPVVIVTGSENPISQPPAEKEAAAAVKEEQQQQQTPQYTPGHRNGNAVATTIISTVNKIEQAMDLVKSHLMSAVREEVDVLKDKIVELYDIIHGMEQENALLKSHIPPEILSSLVLPSHHSPPRAARSTTGPSRQVPPNISALQHQVIHGSSVQQQQICSQPPTPVSKTAPEVVALQVDSHHET